DATRNDQPPILESRPVVPLPLQSRPESPVAIRGRGRGEVVGEQKAFRLLLFRQAKKVRLVVQPLRVEKIAAKVTLPGKAPLKERETEDGLEFELGEARALSGARVRVEIGDYALDVE